MNCEANDKSGLGHFQRCLQLADAFRIHRPEVEVIFFGAYDDFAADLLQRSGLVFNDAFDGWNHESVTSLDAMAADFVIVDTYRAPQSYYDGLSARGKLWGAFDDFGKQDLSAASLVINFRVGAEQLFDYGSRQQALGPACFPVAAGFQRSRECHQAMQLNPEVENVLICMGGSDLHRAGPVLAGSAAQVFPAANIRLLTAEASAYSSERVEVLPLQAEVLPFLEQCDVLITGGGRLKYEACYLGIPNATLSQTQEQHEDTRIMADSGLTLDLGRGDTVDPGAVATGLAALVDLDTRTRMRRAQWDVFLEDGTRRLLTVVCASLQCVA